jgi:aldehyde:ferredoxin oxidoreductase
MLHGYTGKALEVDLTRREVEAIDLNEEWARAFIGGKGLGAKILYERLKPEVSPLTPENLLIFLTGPLTATTAPTSGRWAVVTKSPHTGIFLDSQVGGHFGARLKMAGFDYLTVRGRADAPVYLHLKEGQCQILDARDLWGKGVFATERMLKKRHPGSKVGSIGPAGENLVSYACICFDLYRQAGRGGAGAVMGSKDLKAIVVEGNRKVTYADRNGFAAKVRSLRQLISNHPAMQERRRLGTPLWVTKANLAGFLPTRNFSSGVFENAGDISGEAMRERIVVKDRACYQCPIACGKLSRVSEGKHRGTEIEGPEYETIALLGSNCGIGSIGAIVHGNRLCDDLGLDTITTGNVIGFAMECYQKGLLRHTDGLNLEFGNQEAQLAMIEKIAHREGVGELFSSGVQEAAQTIRRGADEFAIHVKGLELPGVDPRGAFGMALAYATADRGGCHQRCWTPTAELSGVLERFSTEGVAQFVKDTQDERAVCFSLVLCDFGPFSVKDFTQLLNLATGFDLKEAEYLAIGERIWNLTRMFNVREGITRRDDTLPARFLEEPLPEGDAKGQVVTREALDRMLGEYYQLRGWDENGLPGEHKLRELGL